MKKIFTAFIILAQTAVSAQSQDLYSLAKGDYLGFNALFDQNRNLYGYIALYSYGKSTEKTKKFEYVILDKNLNPVANKEFEGDITAANYAGYIDFRKKIILQPTEADYYNTKSRDYFVPRSMEIDLATNTVSTKKYYDYDHGTFKEVVQPKAIKQERKENRAEKNEKGFNYKSGVFEIKEGGFLALEYDDYGNYQNHNILTRFDENQKELWKYAYNTNGEKRNYDEIKVLDKDEKYIYATKLHHEKGDIKYSFIAIDMKTGKEAANKSMDNLSPETNASFDSFYSLWQEVRNSKNFDDRLTYLSRNWENSRDYTGFIRTVIDKNTLSLDFKNISFKPDFEKYIPNIGKTGSVESGYSLISKDNFFLKDGSIGMLFEKYKPEGQYTAPKTTDLVYVFTDKDFKIKNIKVFTKEKTKWDNSDYLFSQYLNDGKDVVFFYRDLEKDTKTKEKNWKLFINTLIDGNFKQEIVPISEKDNYTVVPYVGKEGYILLREFNEKDKFNKIRLERLNY